MAITGVLQSTTIAIISVSKQYDFPYHSGSPLKQSITIATIFLQLQLLITDIVLDAFKSYYTLLRFHIWGDLNHVIDVIFFISTNHPVYRTENNLELAKICFLRGQNTSTDIHNIHHSSCMVIVKFDANSKRMPTTITTTLRLKQLHYNYITITDKCIPNYN